MAKEFVDHQKMNKTLSMEQLNFLIELEKRIEALEPPKPEYILVEKTTLAPVAPPVNEIV